MKIRPSTWALPCALLTACGILSAAAPGVRAETLEEQLLAEGVPTLARAALADGDPQRGAIVFHQAYLACAKCHQTAAAADMEMSAASRLGPSLVERRDDLTPEVIVEAILAPSKTIRKGFEAVTIVTHDGKSRVGLLVEQTPARVVIRDASDGSLVTMTRDMIDELAPSKNSLMPVGQANQLAGRQQFLDLVRYVVEIQRGGADRARQLQPPASLLVLRLPEYESHLNHGALIRGWNTDSFRRGEAIYQRVCANCHGTHDQPGSLPTSLRFAQGKFKNGGDPHAMYQTITRGFGFMVPQTWMVPRQKYDVIHYIREAYLKSHNPSQYVAVDEAYLRKLPAGDTLGPEPSSIEPWAAMDYGPSLINTYEIPSSGDKPNFAYKGIAVRLDSGPGGVSRGRHWMMLDHDTLRLAAAWSGQGFIDWNGIHFNGRHQAHPRLVGHVSAATGVGPGWAHPVTGSFEDPRVRGRDGRAYGPLPRDWAHFRGVYHHEQRTVISYTVGSTNILESPAAYWPAESRGRAGETDGRPVFVRQMVIGPHARPLTMVVATAPWFFDGDQERDPSVLVPLGVAVGPSSKAAPGTVEPGTVGKRDAGTVPAVVNGFLVEPSSAAPSAGPSTATEKRPAAKTGGLTFADGMHFEIERAGDFDLASKDYSIAARLQTKRNGTIFAQAAASGPWIHDGKALFLRGGRVVFDIGWVGAVASKRRVDDGRWHDVVMTWQHETSDVRFYIDGKLDQQGKLRPKAPVARPSVRIGMAAENFPDPSYFGGELREVRFYQRRLSDRDVADLSGEWAKTDDSNDAATGGATDGANDAENKVAGTADVKLVAKWRFDAESHSAETVKDLAGGDNTARRVGTSSSDPATKTKLIVGSVPPLPPQQWHADLEGRITLTLPPAEQTLRLAVWTTQAESVEDAASRVGGIANVVQPVDLERFTHGGPARWPQSLATAASLAAEQGPFAVDVLTHPADNPWLAQVRLTGFDFYPDGDRAAVCAWDGDVWLVSGLAGLNRAAEGKSTDPPAKSGGSLATLQWKRIATGLFQPLGLKIIKDKIYVTCRDQIAILHDLNGDGETDFYENFNNDHQVTEHFHEFAMGLQVDDQGNLYYAKSARHAFPAVVPHHGTLLRVTPDGSRTDILAVGFRAANGVCLNPDGTFIVTDQEGHWNPKNRINWVVPAKDGGKPPFYGNMFGYHDITDSSDAAMIPPLCWITNAFDRSPAELLWVPKNRWGSIGGSLLNLSYGYGKIFIVPHEEVSGQKQGGMSPLPIPLLPTGVMRGRFHPIDGQLYACGMFAWAGNATQPGGWYRVRYTGKPVYLPTVLHAETGRLKIGFSGDLDRDATAKDGKFDVKVWGLKRTANYGSQHIDEHPLKVSGARVLADSRTVVLDIPELAPTWCMEIRYSIRTASGETIDGVINNTIHHLAPSRPDP